MMIKVDDKKNFFISSDYDSTHIPIFYTLFILLLT